MAPKALRRVWANPAIRGPGRICGVARGAGPILRGSRKLRGMSSAKPRAAMAARKAVSPEKRRSPHGRRCGWSFGPPAVERAKQARAGKGVPGRRHLFTDVFPFSPANSPKSRSTTFFALSI